MSQQDIARYQLPPDENRRIFASDIVPDHLTGPTPQDPATAVFLLGQPGAGKTRVAQLVAEALDARGGFVDVDSDLYKPLKSSIIATHRVLSAGCSATTATTWRPCTPTGWPAASTPPSDADSRGTGIGRPPPASPGTGRTKTARPPRPSSPSRRHGPSAGQRRCPGAPAGARRPEAPSPQAYSFHPSGQTSVRCPRFGPSGRLRSPGNCLSTTPASGNIGTAVIGENDHGRLAQ